MRHQVSLTDPTDLIRSLIGFGHWNFGIRSEHLPVNGILSIASPRQDFACDESGSRIGGKGRHSFGVYGE